MFIEKLTLTDFRSHQDTNFTFDRLTIIRGANGSGKSSIAMAIEAVLSNRIQGITAENGSGGEKIIRVGAKTAKAEASFLNNGARGLLTWERNGRGATWSAGMASGAQAASVIEKNIAPISCIRACLNAHRFLGMTENEQRDLLARALASEPVKWATDELMKSWEGPLPNDGYVREAADIDRLYKHFYELRADVNRESKALGEGEKPVAPDGMPSVQQVKQGLAERQAELTKLSNQRVADLIKYESCARRYEAAKVQKDIYDKDTLSNAEVKKIQKVLGNASEAKKLDVKITEIQTGVRSGREQISLLDRKLASQQEFCQSCGQKLSDVDTAKNDIQKEIDELTVKVRDAEDELSKLQLRRADLGDPEFAAQRFERHTAAIRATSASDEILKALAPAKPDTSTLDAEIRDLDARVARGQEILAQVAEYEAQMKLYQQRVERKEVLARKSNAYERMVEYFGPKSPLREQLVGDRLGPFVARMNVVMKRFGFGCSISMDPFSIIVSLHPNDDAAPAPGFNKGLFVSQLSESEQYRFSIAFQIALAEATKVGLVVIDRADMLLPSVRKQLSEELGSSALDQAIVLVAGEPTGQYPVVDGLKFIELTNSTGTTQLWESTAYATAG